MREPEVEYLYHFTCDHGAQGIRERGMVLPVAMVVQDASALDQVPATMRWATNYSWWTNISEPEYNWLGLQSVHLFCDRMANCFRAKVAPGYAQWWPVVLRELRLDYARMLSLTPGARPATWWVCRGPVHVEEVLR